jgi:hypothetical protein
MVPADPLRMIAFFEQCQATNRAAGVHDKIAKDKKQLKEKKTASRSPSCSYVNSSEYMNSLNNMNSSDYMNSPNNMNSSDYMNSLNYMNSSDYMNSPNYMNSSEYMNSPNYMNSLEYMNSPNNMNSSEYMNSPNDMNSSDYMNSHVPLCVFVPDKELDCLTDSHIKLNSLDDMQECLSNSNHKIAFDYDKDTMSLMEELTLDTLEVLLSNNTIHSAGNGTIAFEYHGYEIEADTPRFNYHGPKIKIPKQELPITICTTNTIGTIRSRRLF